MAGDTPKSRNGMRPGMRALLIGSVAINLIVAGLIGGAVLGNKRIQDRPPRDGDLIGAYTRALMPEERRAIGRAMREKTRDQDGPRLGPRAQVAEMLAALRAETFDPVLVKSLLEAQSQQAFNRREAVQDLWIVHLQGLTLEERTAYADRVEEQLRKRPGPKKGGKP